MSLHPSSSLESEDLSTLIQDLRESGFDAIRFASYRTAAKLRYIQKKSNIRLLDIWNVIEGIRENGLNALEPYSIITVPKLESLVTSLLVNLNKRLPVNEQVDVYSCVRYLLSWLLIAYDGESSGRIRVFSVKVGLVTLCSGKLIDKLRYIYSQISDAQGYLVLSRFADFLEELLAIPAMVLESQTFGFTESLPSSIFEGTAKKVTVNGFIEAIMGEPGPPCLMWLPLLHSMASVEEVNHGLHCNVCKRSSIQGFRYKCQKCSNFNMCQDCFWQGKTGENHSTDHEVKEYVTNKSSGRSFRDSFRKSFKCVPEKSKKIAAAICDQPERPLNLSHIVPPSPVPVHNGFGGGRGCREELDAYSDQRMFALELGQSPQRNSGYSQASSLSESDEEHRLIARYTARLASETKYSHKGLYSPGYSISGSLMLGDSTRSQRDMIAQLEIKNREILQEIARLRAQQDLYVMNGEVVDPSLLEELQALRFHKSDLEEKLFCLLESRKQLMDQLEGLMRMLKVQQASSKSTPNASPLSGLSAPAADGLASLSTTHHRSAPVTPHANECYRSITSELRAAYSIADEIQTVGSGSSGSSVATVVPCEQLDSQGKQLRSDLLSAADSVTNAMSSLVKELNGSAMAGQEDVH